MMSRVTIRGLFFSGSALFALALAGCAEAPEQDPTDAQTEIVGEAVEEFGLQLPGSAGHQPGSSHGFSSEKTGPRSPDDDDSGNSDIMPGRDRTEPDPVPWVPRYLAASDS